MKLNMKVLKPLISLSILLNIIFLVFLYFSSNEISYLNEQLIKYKPKYSKNDTISIIENIISDSLLYGRDHRLDSNEFIEIIKFPYLFGELNIDIPNLDVYFLNNYTLETDRNIFSFLRFSIFNDTAIVEYTLSKWTHGIAILKKDTNWVFIRHIVNN